MRQVHCGWQRVNKSALCILYITLSQDTHILRDTKHKHIVLPHFSQQRDINVICSKSGFTLQYWCCQGFTENTDKKKKKTYYIIKLCHASIKHPGTTLNCHRFKALITLSINNYRGFKTIAIFYEFYMSLQLVSDKTFWHVFYNLSVLNKPF